MADHLTAAERLQAQVWRLARLSRERNEPEAEAEEPGQMALERELVEGDEE